MKRATIVLGLLTILMIASVVPVAAASFRAVIHETFGRRASAQPCVAVGDIGIACPGTGTVQGYGNVTSSIFFPTCYPSCDLPLVRTLTFSNESTLVLLERPIDQRIPGKSRETPGRGYGGPAFDHFSWVVDSGTGMFQGATGAGEWVNVQAGDTIVLKFEGTLTTS